jgi:hypothetical protein
MDFSTLLALRRNSLLKVITFCSVLTGGYDYFLLFSS